jgi:phosphatidylethanolamine-binding protein (PEBP) family uncharacterized protein
MIKPLRGLPAIVTAGALVASLAVAGCGSTSASTSSSNSTSASTSARKSPPPLTFSSPALGHNGTIPANYTCDGSNTSLPLRWTNVPPGTAELIIYVLKPIHVPKGKKAHALVQWVVAGISPQLHGMGAGKLPQGAIVGINSVEHKTDYSICPEKGTLQPYIFDLFAMPSRASLTAGFDGGKMFEEVNTSSLTRALFVGTYKRS